VLSDHIVTASKEQQRQTEKLRSIRQEIGGLARSWKAKEKAHNRYLNSEAFCQMVMDKVTPASSCEYGGTRLSQTKRQQLYWKFIQIRTAGTVNHSAIARAFNVSRPTIAAWEKRFMVECQMHGMLYERREGQGIKNRLFAKGSQKDRYESRRDV